jgi:hypothetical protein
MSFANFDFDEKTPQVLKDALRSMNSNRKLGSNFFKATGLDVETYLRAAGWETPALDIFELGLYVSLEMTKQAVSEALKKTLKLP